MSADAAKTHGFVARPQARGPGAAVRPYLSVTAAGEGDARTAEIVIYGYIGESYDWWTGEDVGNSAQNILDQIRELGDVSAVTVRVNSLGGDAWAGSAIYSLLKAMKATVTVVVDGVAASAASVIAMAADDLRMPGNALLMLHNPSTMAWGEEGDLQKAIATLQATKRAMISAYREKNPAMSEEEVAAILDAETWYTGAEAVEAGWADTLVDDVRIEARAIPPVARFRNAPAAALALIEAAQGAPAPAAGEPPAADPVDPPAADPEPAPEPAPEPPAAPAVDPALVEAVAAAVAARMAPPAPPPAADADRLTAIRAHAERRGVMEAFEAQVAMGASLDVLHAEVNRAAAAREAPIQSSAQPAGEPGPRPERTITHSDVADIYAARRKRTSGDAR